MVSACTTCLRNILAYVYWVHLPDGYSFAKPTCLLMQASDTDIQGASQAKVSEVNKETEVKLGPQSKTVGKSLQPRATRSRTQMHKA